MDPNNLPPALIQQLMAQFGQSFQEFENESESEEEFSEEKILAPLEPGNKVDEELVKFFKVNRNEGEDSSDSDEDSEKDKKAQNKGPKRDWKSIYDSRPYSEIFVELAFGKKSRASGLHFLRDIYDGHHLESGVCGKIFKPGDIAYECLDCGLDPTCIICKECFEDGDHKGHRFKIKTNVSGMCDCGDPDAWRPEGNCSKHNGFIKEDNIMSEEVKDKLVKAFKRLLFYIIQGLEKNRGLKKARQFYSKNLLDLLNYLKSVRDELPTIACFLGRGFRETFTKDFGTAENPVKLSHKCNDFSGEHEELEEPVECTSSVLRNLIRFSVFLELDAQKKLNEFLSSLFVDFDFKVHFAVEYLKMINYTIRWDLIGKNHDSKEAVSALTDLSIQILTSEDLAEIAIEQATLIPLFDGLIKVIDKYIAANKFIDFDNMFYNKIQATIGYCLMKKKGFLKFLKDRKSIEKYCLFMEEINKKCVRLNFTDSPDLSLDGNIDSIFVFEMICLRESREAFSNMIPCDHDEVKECWVNFFVLTKEAIFRMMQYEENNFLKKGRKGSVEDSEKADGDTSKKNYAQSFILPLQRTYIQTLISYLFFESKDKKVDVVEIQKQRLEELNSLVFENEVEKRKFWVKMTDSFSACLGFNREVVHRIWSQYGPINHQLKHYYYTREFHNSDLVGLQLCAYHLPSRFPELMFKRFFQCPAKQHLTQLNFKKALLEFKGESADKRDGLIRTFFDFFSYLTEILSNEVNLIHLIEIFIENVDKMKNNFNHIKIGTKNPENLYKARSDFLFSFLAGSPPTQSNTFLKFIANYVKDKEVFNRFMASYGQVNRLKRLIMIKRDSLEKAVKKSQKNRSQFKEFKAGDKLPSMEVLPNFNTIWYDPIKRGAYFSELSEKLSMIVKSKETFQPDLLSYGKVFKALNELSWEPRDDSEAKDGKNKSRKSSKAQDDSNNAKKKGFLPNLFPPKKSLKRKKKNPQTNNDDDPSNWEDVDGAELTPLGIIHSMKSYFAPLYLFTLVCIDNYQPSNPTQKENLLLLIALVKEFIHRNSRRLSGEFYFNEFCLKFKVLTSKYDKNQGGDMASEAATNEEEKKRLAEEKRKKKQARLKRKRDKLKKKFKNKKNNAFKKLLENTDEMIEEIAKEGDEEVKIFCVIDNSAIEKDENYFLLGYMHFSNVVHWAKIQSLNRLMKDENSKFEDGDFEMLTKTRDDLLENLAQNENLVFTSCNHAVKTKNVEELAKNSNQAYEQEESMCPLCKSPSNVLIPVIRNYSKVCSAMAPPDQFNPKELLQDLLFNKEDKHLRAKTQNFEKMVKMFKEVEKQIDSFSNNIMITFNMYLNHSDAVVDRTGGERKIKLLNFDSTVMMGKSLAYMCELGRMVGFFQFVKKNAVHSNLVYKALRLSIVKEVTSKGFAKDYVKKTNAILVDLASLVGSVFRNQEKFLNSCIEDLAMQTFTALTLTTLDEKLLVTLIKQAISVFFNLRRAQIELRTPAPTKAEVQNKIQEFTRRLISYLIIIDYDQYFGEGSPQKDLMEEVLKECLTDGEKQLSTQLALLGLSWEDNQSHKDLVKQMIDLRNKSQKSEEEGTDGDEKMQEEGKEDQMQVVAAGTTTVATCANKGELTNAEVILDKFGRNLDFNLIYLHPSFETTYQQYMHSNCHLCGTRPAKAEFAICLICGEIMCMRNCEKDSISGQQPGNLSAHANKKHGGSAVFLNVMQGTYLLYEKRRFYIYTGIYSDQYGMTFKDLDLNEQAQISNIELSSEKVAELRMLLLQHSLTEKIAQSSVVNNLIYRINHY